MSPKKLNSKNKSKNKKLKLKVKKTRASKKSQNKKIKILKKPTKRSLKPTKKSLKEIQQVKLLQKFDAPIILPNPTNYWEAWQTFNPGVILLDNKIHFLYRAIGTDGVSRLGYAFSNDGFSIEERLPYPVYEHRVNNTLGFSIYSLSSGGSFFGAEDPRLTRVENEDKIYMTYTACDNGLRIGLTSISVSDFLNKKWNWKKPCLISPPGEVHKNWVIFPEKINGKYAILHSLSPEILIAYRDSLDFGENEYIQSYYNPNFKKNNGWDNWIRGAGAPPIKTELGWLLFYHAMTNGEFHKYKVGAMILDYKNPEKILYKLNYPVLEPQEEYENNGFKPGVVYVTGAVVKDDMLLVYYGAADSYINVAYAPLSKFLEAFKGGEQITLKSKKLKVKK
jgi:predicted GH43/DUF377 family glycosyl hydrolase